MSEMSSGRRIDVENEQRSSATKRPGIAGAVLTPTALWVAERNLPFLFLTVGMIVMLLWAGLFKMTSLGAEGITPLVTHSPLVSWQFRLLGPYGGSDMIGLTEITAALLLIVGYFKAEAGIIGAFITTVMFFTTSTMIVTTPGAIIAFHGMRYMSFMGLFLFKDVISFGVSFYLISAFGQRAAAREL